MKTNASFRTDKIKEILMNTFDNINRNDLRITLGKAKRQA